MYSAVCQRVVPRLFLFLLSGLMGKRGPAYRHERAKKAALTRWGRDKGAADERELQKQTGTQERERVLWSPIAPKGGPCT